MTKLLVSSTTPGRAAPVSGATENCETNLCAQRDATLGLTRGTRISVELLLRKLADGAAVEELIDGYPRLTKDDIRACVRYAAIQATERAFDETNKLRSRNAAGLSTNKSARM